MSIAAAQEYTLYTKYANYLPEKKRRETWKEQVERVFQMHRDKYGSRLEGMEEDFRFAIDMVKEKRILGSQRSLQFGGGPILSKEARLYNCTSSYVDRPRFFQECLWLLLCGCGAGFSVQKHHVEKLPPIAPRTKGKATYVIPDSIEGWADSVGVIMSSYFDSDETPFPEYRGYEVEFDASSIRPKGASLSWGGTAPGPQGLVDCLGSIETLLNARVSKSTKLRPIDTYDVNMFASDAVLSGGVRRCLPKGSKVFLRDGVRSIEDIKVGDEVVTSQGYKKVLNNFEQGVQDLLKINTQDGFFECTPNHKMAVLDGVNSFKWVKAEDLKPEDRLITNTFANEGSITKLPDYTYEKPLHSTTCDDIIIPDLDEKMAWFIGLFHGNGYVLYTPNRSKTSGEPRANNGNHLQVVFPLDAWDHAIEAQKQVERFGVVTTLEKRKNENSYILKASSKQLSEYFFTHVKQPNTTITIPEFIWNASLGVKLAYASGTFDSDGAANNKPVIVCTSVYPQFLLDLQVLLYSCGITTRFKESSKDWASRPDHWQQLFNLALINKKDKELFCKSPVLFKTVKMGKMSRLTNALPSAFIKADPHFKGRHTELGACSNKQVSVDRCEEYGKEIFLTPCEVVSVESGRTSETFDIEVEDAHQFYCNGYLTHNSATICLFSPDDKEMMEAKTGNWFMENPQRGRSNNSALLVRGETTKEFFDSIKESTRQFGEPAFVWAEDRELLVNPCYSIDTKILTEDGWRTFRELLGKTPTILQDGRVTGKISEEGEESWDIDLNKPNSTITNVATKVFQTGTGKEVFTLTLSCGRQVKATGNHHFATPTGMVELKDLVLGDEILIPLPRKVIVEDGPEFQSGVSSGSSFRKFKVKGFEWLHRETKHYKMGFITGLELENSDESDWVLKLNSREDLQDIQLILQELGWLSKIKGDKLILDTSEPSVVVSVESAGTADVYCLKEDNVRTLIAEGMTARRCVEIGMRAYDDDGVSGWQFCNLVEINAKKIKTEEDFYQACRAGGIIGTLQAGYDRFEYLTKASENIVKKEALLGVSMTGMMDSPEICFDPEIQKKGAELVLEVNSKISKIIGINETARATCVKPAGTTSIILGTASGIHPHHAKRYFRRIQANKMEFPAQHFESVNPRAVEDSVWSRGGTDVVLTFLCEVPPGSRTKNQVDAITLLDKHVRVTQQNWVEYGTRHSACVKPWLRHNVSNTITVKEDEWDVVFDYIYENRKWFAGVSLLPSTGDRDYPQAPFTEVLNAQEITKEYGDGAVMASGLVVAALAAFDNNLWKACDAAQGLGDPLTVDNLRQQLKRETEQYGKVNTKIPGWYPNAADADSTLTTYLEATTVNLELKLDFVRRAKQFADRYFGKNIRKMTRCLKDVNNWKHWLDLSREYKQIDWSQVVEENGAQRNMEAGEACAGGSCEIGDLGAKIKEEVNK